MSNYHQRAIARKRCNDGVLVGRELRLSRRIPHHKPLRPCPNCGGAVGCVGAGAGPHRLSVRCVTCRRVRWLSDAAVECVRDEFVETKSNHFEYKLGLQLSYLDFCGQKGQAAQRGITFLLTYEEWCTIWRKSGHWHERGSRRGQYVMSRPHDRGPYATWNVRIIKAEENCRDGGLGRVVTKKTRAKLSATMHRKAAAAKRREPSKRSKRC